MKGKRKLRERLMVLALTFTMTAGMMASLSHGMAAVKSYFVNTNALIPPVSR